jgi:hypothetical protein
MIHILLIFIAVATLAILVGRDSSARWIGTTGALVLIYFVGLVVWWYALYFQIVPVYRWLATLGIYRTEGVLGGLIHLGPPVIPAAAWLAIAFRPLRRRR